MYSMVLMMALGGGTAAPADHHGCYSGCGGVVVSHGCHGGGCHGGGHKLFGGGGLFSRHHGCNSCATYAVCSGGSGCSSYYGCSSCSSCHGGGGHKLFGRLFNRGGHGCHGCHSGCYTSHSCASGTVIHHGCHHGCAAPAAAPAPMKKTMPAAEPVGKPAKEEEARLNTTATMIVSVPSEAKLTIDGKATVSTSATRVFVTPELEVGQTYRYTLEAALVRDGQTVTSSKEVTVRAGEETRVNIEFPTANVVSR